MGQVLLKGGYLLDLDREFEVGDLLLQDGEIVKVGGVIEAPGSKLIDARARVIIPGLINAHTHSNQSLERGLCDRLPLDAWMVLASYGGAGARLTPRDLYVSTMLGAMEMLQTGTTSVLDCARVDLEWFDEGIDAILEAYADVGMRASIAVQYADLDFFSSIPTSLLGKEAPPKSPSRSLGIDAIMARVEAYIGRWTGKNSRLTPCLGPSSIPRCSTELFEASVALAKQKKVHLQTHLLSAKSQVAVATERFRGPTVRYLEELGALKGWASYAHGIWLDDEEIGVLAATDAVVVHNPVSNLKLGAGIAPIPSMLQAGVTVALGSDGASSNDNQNMFETIKSAAILHRVATPPELWPGAVDALRMCWDGGSAAMGERIGRLSPNYKGDLTLLRTPNIFISPKEQMLQQLVYSERGSNVDIVLVNGEIVVSDGRLVTIDVDRILAEAQDVVTRIWANLPERHRRFEELRSMLEMLERKVGALPLKFARTCW